MSERGLGHLLFDFELARLLTGFLWDGFVNVCGHRPVSIRRFAVLASVAVKQPGLSLRDTGGVSLAVRSLHGRARF